MDSSFCLMCNALARGILFVNSVVLVAPQVPRLAS